MMSLLNVLYSTAVGDHVSLEVPRLAQLVFQQEGIGAGGLAVNAVVGAHHRSRFRLGNGSAKGWQVSVFLVVARDRDVRLVACRLRPAVYGVVLRCGNHAVVLGIIALHTGDEGDAHAAGKKRIFSVSFLPASPARIAKNIDCWCPEV